MSNPLDKLAKIIEHADQDFIQKKEFADSLKSILDVMKNLKAQLENQIAKNDSSCSDMCDKMMSNMEKKVSEMMKSKMSMADMNKALKDVLRQINDIKTNMPMMPDLSVLEGKINEITAYYDSLTPEQLRNDLESLKGDNRLDASAVKNIPTVQTRSLFGGGLTGLHLYVDGTKKGAVKTLNIKAGTGVALTYAQTNGLDTITISASAVSAGYQSPTGTVNGINKTFVFTTAPNAIVVDGIIIRKTQADGTANWTGTTTVVLTIAPTYEIFGIS